ncbi:T9SS type B sorting domain-containing protein [Pedobacter frigidisoli]|uniref:T9SS type B sorting domain-containing protein n=1 Tax=Pedobacter frigidisoli TaxID=2530455 RepID=A0A4R0P265_9SPHI|nr:lamin tail domain-containing protein [Pedobacter frigidisoli]TCD10570.1 T9SS type B sorting domain-containing protein [Pedobacter frigidisoli]
MKRPLLLILFFLFSLPIFAQVTLTTSPYAENFNGIGTGLPTGFTVRTGASATTLGATAILTTAATAWNNTSGAFKNFASATAGSAASTATQAAATDRALGLKQTGAVGDPGGAFVFQIDNTTAKTGFKLSFDLQSLDVAAGRTTGWRVDYGFGATPTFTDAGAGTTNTSTVFANTTINVDFGTALDNSAGPVWIRVVALVASTGSGSRPTTAIDNFNLTFTSGATASPTLTATPNSLDFGTQLTNTSSAEKTFVLGSANLNATSVGLTTAAPFAIAKTSGGTFATSLTYTSAELTSGSNTVYTKFTPLTTGTLNGSITISGGGASTPPSVALTGIGQSAVLTVDKTSLDFGSQVSGTNSTAQTYTLSATGLTDVVTVATNTPFYISKDNVTFSTSLTYSIAELATSKTVYARFTPSTATSSTDNISIASAGATTQTIAVTGIGTTPPAAPTHIVISEVYGGGGNSGATFKNDFIELYNPGNTAVDLTGWSVQYSSAAGTGTWAKTDLAGSIPAKSFFLIQAAAGTGGTVNLPTPDVIGTLALSGTTGKIILSNSNSLLTGANPSTAVVVDKVGFGPTATGFETAPTPVISNTTSIERKAGATSTAATLSIGGSEEFNGNGYDTDNNNTNFVVTAPNPQNSLVKEPTGANHLVISEVYGGGGNSGSVYKNDFIELYNPTLTAVNLTGWSVQYASAAGTSWQITPLSGTIAPKSFYLVQEAAGTAGTTTLPTVDKAGTIAMAAGAGKVLLANVATAQTGTTPTGTQIVDLVGYGLTAVGFEGTGPAPVPSATFSVERKASATSDATTLGIGGSEEFAGNGYDSDDNSVDFVSKVANPQNSTVTEPASTSGPYLVTTPKTLVFSNQAINTTSAAKSYVLSAGNLTNTTTLTTSAPYTISKDNVTFSTTINYTAADLATNQTVYVKFGPTVIGNATGSILHASAGATSVLLSLTGPAVDPNQTAFTFENCTTVGSAALSDGFYQYNVTGPQTWGCTTTFGHDAADPTGVASLGNALQINGYSSGNILNEDWLISPALNISSFNYAILSFWTRSAFAGDKLQLKISTNYTGSGNPALATWTSIDGKFPETGSDKWTKSDNIDLSAYKATPVYVAIVYNSTTSSASRWTVDDFAVTNSSTPPAVDITTSPSSVSFGFQVANSTSPASTFGFSAGNLTGDVTLTAPANFTLSKTSGGTFGSTLTYAKTDINNTSPTVYAKFSPTTVNTSYAGNVSIATTGSVNKTVAFTGNTFDIANTLEVVNWNIEWFGSPAQDPSNDILQAANVKTVINNLNADIYGLAEVVDTTLFRNTILPVGYNVLFSEFGSYADDKADADYPLAQKLAFMYRTDLIKPISTLGILRDTYNPAVASTSVDGTPYKNWSSGRFPYMMQAQVKINNKLDTVYFIEIHAKANTGTTADQIDSYNRRKGGNKQMKDWIDANLAGKKVIILGDFNDVLDADKTIAPMPGTGTSYSDFTQDVANYFPVTLPLSLTGKQSTAGFPTVIDNVIITKSLNLNYIPASAEVLDAVKNLVTNYSSTTTDHYPIKSRYLFGNGIPTIDAVANQAVCYSSANQTIAVTGISSGPETSQTTTLSITSDNANLFDVLSIAANGTDKGTITYHLKNNVSGVANITVTVMDNGGTDFGGVNKISKTFKLTVTAAATGTITGTTAVCLNGTAPTITFTGANGIAPYTFTYNINGGTSQTITTAGTNSTVTVTAPATVAGTFTYNLVNVKDANCGQPQTGTATVTVRALATASISGSTAIPQNGTAPVITFTGANGTAPYTFTYNINGGTGRTVTSTGNTATVSVPTTAVGTFVYNLISVADVNCGQAQTGSATVLVRPLPVATIAGTTSVCIFSTSPAVTFTGSVGTAPYTFTYTVNGSSNRTVTTNSTTATVSAPTGTAGTFTYTLVSVADAYANQLQTGAATVTVNPLPIVSISSNKGVSISKGDAIILSATGGTQYSWTGAEITGGQTTAAAIIRPKQSGTYKVTVTNASGCVSDQSITITVIDDYKLEASTVVTPNGDGYNDKFIIKNIDYYPNNTLKIFDKAGRILYTKHTYANDWDGTVNGSPLSEGTYYYIIDLGTGIGTFKGFINIIRD